MPKTAFRPEQHGYPFINSWKMEQDERVELRQTLTRSTGEAASGVGNDPFGMIRGMVTTALDSWIDAALPDYYGLCGGMAFSAADHFRAGMVVPTGPEPGRTPDSDDPNEKPIRDYLWRRQLESLQPNASVLLSWMMMLHLPIPGAGPIWLRDRTREQFQNLKGFLTHGPWPLCLIGSSTSPFNNHQVLAIGIEDNGDQTGTVYLYDSNGPGREQTIKLDMRGDVVQAVESCPSPERGALRGFFCMHYTPATPPAGLPRKGSAPKPAAPKPAAPKPATKPSAVARPATKPSTVTRPATKPSTTTKPATKPSAATRPASKPAAKPSTLVKPVARSGSAASGPAPESTDVSDAGAQRLPEPAATQPAARPVDAGSSAASPTKPRSEEPGRGPI